MFNTFKLSVGIPHNICWFYLREIWSKLVPSQQFCITDKQTNGNKYHISKKWIRGKWTGKRIKIEQVRKYRCIFDTHARRCSRSLISVIPRSAWSLSKYICFLSPVSTRSCRDWNAHLCSFCRTGSCLTTFSRKYAYICTYIHRRSPCNSKNI